MPETVKRLRLFVASPGDVAEERERLAKVVDALRIHVAAAHGLDLELVRWETHVRPGAGADAQAVVNPQIGTYDLFIGILWNRFGTPTKRAESGTREEFDQAYARWQKDPSSLEIWVYFSQQPYTFTSAQELAQKGKVLAFQKELQEKKGLLVWTYKDPADFEEQVRGHLELFIPKYASSVRAAPTMEATLIGNGAIAQGAGAMAAGKGGVVAKTIQGPVMTGEHSQLIQADVVIQQAAAESPGPDWSLLQATYLRRLQVLANALPLAIIDPRAVERTRQQTMDLLAVYVALNTRTMVEVEEGKDRGREKRRQPERLLEPGREARPLTALEAVGRDRQMVLLGDPGSGKSTFANYLALCLAGARLEQAGQPSEMPSQNWLGQLPAWPHGPVLPLQVALRHLEKSPWCDGTAGGLWNFIEETLTTQNLGDFARYLRQELLNGHVLVILDGLDEVADPQKRECVRHAVAAFAATYNHPANRYLVTCRTYAYQDPQRQLPGFTAHALSPFDAEQIDRFIACWYEEVRRLGWKSESEAQDLTGRLQAATRRPDLAPLAENPLQLTMMASLHYSWGRLPDDRVELYRQMVDLLLVRWQEARLGEDVGVTRAVSAADLESALERMAFVAHRAQESTAGTADISEAVLRHVLKDYLEGSWDRAGELVSYIQQRAGLLIERGPGLYTFPHRSYQEYLAGCHLAVQPDFPDQAARLVQENYAQWREVALWAVGVTARSKYTHIAVDVVRALCPREVPDQRVSPTDWLAASLAGEALLETGLKEVRAREQYQPVVERVQRWLVALAERGALSPVDRAAAGRTLAHLDDPRPGVGLSPLPVGEGPGVGRLTEPPAAAGRLPDILWCPVPAGPFLMGTREADIPALLKKYGGEQEWYKWETPQHEEKSITQPYLISRYPVTNAQFQVFVDDPEGYRHNRWWTQAGLRWWGQRTGPEKYGGVYDLPNHPVVMVTWYEAVAFCRWLTERLRIADCQLPIEGQVDDNLKSAIENRKFVVRLPTEAEWEKAASWAEEQGSKGKQRIWPWGDEFNAEQCNMDDTGIGSTCAVGLFPGGDSPYGCADMAGNVWEWCQSKWVGNYQHYDRGVQERESLEGSDPRVVRGGAFNYDRGGVRCAARNGSSPGGLYWYFGFRLVVSPL